jgi:hypothetical protein
VTLGRLVLAWLSVALWFMIVEMLRRTADGGWRLAKFSVSAAEALLVTLFAALWFDSLGHGGWWLLFFLVGLMAGFPARLRELPQGAPARRVLLLGLLDTARYVVAGGILAWRLA